MIAKIPQKWETYQHDTIDKVGSIMYTVGILLFVYEFTTLITTTSKLLTVTGIILLVIFGLYELGQKSPVFDMTLFRNKKFTS